MLGEGQHLTYNNVEDIFTQYLVYMKQEKFYMATDDASVEHIQK